MSSEVTTHVYFVSEAAASGQSHEVCEALTQAFRLLLSSSRTWKTKYYSAPLTFEHVIRPTKSTSDELKKPYISFIIKQSPDTKFNISLLSSQDETERPITSPTTDLLPVDEQRYSQYSKDAREHRMPLAQLEDKEQPIFVEIVNIIDLLTYLNVDSDPKTDSTGLSDVSDDLSLYIFARKNAYIFYSSVCTNIYRVYIYIYIYLFRFEEESDSEWKFSIVFRVNSRGRLYNH